MRPTPEDWLSLLPQLPQDGRNHRPGEHPAEAAYRARAAHIRSLDELTEEAKRGLLDLLKEQYRNDPTIRALAEASRSQSEEPGDPTPQDG